MVPTSTNGAASVLSESTTNDVMLKTLDFDATTSESAQFNIRFPKSWDEGTITFAPYWTASGGTVSQGVSWDLAAVALADSDLIDTAFGTAQSSIDTLIAVNDIHVGPTSSAITVSNTPTAGDIVMFKIFRDVADASDTLSVDARLIGLALFFTIDTGTDV
jgi:hypothetical protein